jgi:Flp pilus assembly protein TadG
MRPYGTPASGFGGVTPRDSLATRQSRGQRGQTIVEFALVAPVLLFLFFGVLEGSLLVFTMGTYRYSAAQAASQDAELGNASNADTQAIQTIQSGPVGQTALASVQHIDIYHLIQQSNGQLTVDTAKYNSYNLNGTAISVTWPPSARNVRNGSSDFLGLTIYYQYTWKSGVLLRTGPLNLTQTFYVRLEPESY